MLNFWRSHVDYQSFVSDTISSFSETELLKLQSYSKSREKLDSLNLDPIGVLLAPYYSNTGRPAKNQPEILRSFVLMMDLGFTSIDRWQKYLKNDFILSTLIGCTLDSLPPLGSYYDFIDRLWLRNPEFEKNGRNDLFSSGKNKKPSQKPGKGKKLANRHSGITEIIADHIRSEKDFPFYYEELLQQLFSLAAVVPSCNIGLIDTNDLTISGDGTCVHAHANSYGHKKCNCLEQGILNCTCDRHYSDVDASWGWDSDLNAYYYGHTLYMFSYHNNQIGTDVPLHIRFFDAKRHDSVSALVCLSEFRKLHPDLAIKNICLDSANDNYATYQLLHDWNICPFIDLNTNRGRPSSIPDSIQIDTDGTPLCQAGYRMINWGMCPQKHARKWRCPVACGKEEACDCKSNCSSSAYGRCVYTKPEWDLRLYPPVPRGTDAYKKIYNNRTGSERVNDRILNDYKLHSMYIHGKKRFSFFAMIAGINIHLDAQIKYKKNQSV